MAVALAVTALMNRLAIHFTTTAGAKTLAPSLIKGLTQRRPVVVDLVLHESLSVAGSGYMLLDRRALIFDVDVTRGVC